MFGKYDKQIKLGIIILIIFLLTYLVGVKTAGIIVLVVFIIGVIIKKDTIITYIALLNLARNNIDKGKEQLEKLVNKDTKVGKAYMYYANLLLRDGEGEKSKQLLLKGLSLKNDVVTYKNTKLSLASAYWLCGEIPQAIDTLESLRDEFEYVNAFALTTLGYMYLLNDDLEKAREITLLAIEDNADSHGAWDNLGQINYKEGNFEEAKKNFEKALITNETLVDSLYYLGCIYEKDGDLEKAKEYFNKAINAPINSLNTVTKEMIEDKLNN